MSAWLAGFIVGLYVGAALTALGYLWADRPTRPLRPGGSDV